MTVQNMGFMLDRLGLDCAPLQYLRELTQNSIEAILSTPDKRGEVVWDVDWTRHTLTDIYKLAVIDTGIGMTGEEMVQYINALSSSMYSQSSTGNFGIGAKIAAATRNHRGLVYLSWKGGVGYMVHLWRDPESGEYGLRQFPRPDGTFGHWGMIEDSVKPAPITNHGTMVVLLGNRDTQHTMDVPSNGVPSPSRWIARYLNTRYYRFPDGIVVKAREGWESPRSDTDRNLLRTITGQKAYLDRHAEASGTEPLTGAMAHWWLLKDEPAASQNSGFIASVGHTAALFQDELYEMQSGRAGVARLQQFGVIFGPTRVVIYVEPLGGPDRQLSSNTARTQLLLDGEPLPWAEWAAEFRSKLPDEIVVVMEEVTGGKSMTDHRQAIRDRLRQIRELFRFSRYRPTHSGSLELDSESAVVGGRARESNGQKNGESTGSGGAGGRAGDVYSLFLKAGGVPGEEVRTDPDPEPIWVSVLDGTRTPGDMEDRAGRYLWEQNKLMINADFRVYTDLIDRWTRAYSHAPSARVVVQDVVREWFEQALIETVLGIHGLRDAQQWTVDDLKKSLSDEALTAAVMPRYHIDNAVKRALGSKLGTLKDRGVAAELS